MHTVLYAYAAAYITDPIKCTHDFHMHWEANSFL